MEAIPESWQGIVGDEVRKPYFQTLEQFVAEERKSHLVFPPEGEVFTALRLTPYPDVKVFILGQDPYHDVNQAHGLAFSVRPGVTPPPSLKNIFKELQADLGGRMPNNGAEHLDTVLRAIRLAAGERIAHNNPAPAKLNELLAEPDENINWIVDDLLSGGGLSIVVSKPKVGKSTFVRQLALAVASGTPFLNRQTAKGSVLYVSLEDKRSDVRKHFKLLGATGKEDVHIFVGSLPGKAQKWLEDKIKEVHPVLVIIDTLFRFVPISNVNDYAEVTAALSPLLSLTRTHNTHVMMLHHARKGGGEGGDATLGSTAIFGTVDTSILLKRSETRRTIETQQRSGTDIESTVLMFDEATRTISLGGTKQESDEHIIMEDILDFLQTQDEPVSEKIINEAVDGKTMLQRRALRTLFTEGKIERCGEGRRGDPYLYSCSLVPTIRIEQAKHEVVSVEKTEEINIISCSQPTEAISTEGFTF